MKKVLYFADLISEQYGFTEDIKKALEKEREVIAITVNDRDFDYENLIKKIEKVDLFLFHHGGVDTSSDFAFSASLERLKQLLSIIKCKKVWWMPDKMWFLNDRIGEEIMPLVDYAFFNDGNWVRRHKYENAFELHMGTGQKKKGKYRKEYDLEATFIGVPYNFRKPFLDRLRQEYGNKFKIFSNVWGRDFNNLCVSAKYVFVPPVPNEEFYWDNRIYEVLNAGGLLVYPRLYGLEQEGFVDGVHYLTYKRWDDLKAILEDYADKEKDRKEIAEAGQKFVRNNFTYEKRIKELLKNVNG